MNLRQLLSSLMRARSALGNAGPKLMSGRSLMHSRQTEGLKLCAPPAWDARSGQSKGPLNLRVISRAFVVGKAGVVGLSPGEFEADAERLIDVPQDVGKVRAVLQAA